MPDFRYPIGPFSPPATFSADWRQGAIDAVEQTPARFREAVQGLNGDQLETPYRAGGWTVRQVVHHVPDSHLNAYIRLKLALTEDTPTIKPYDESLWAKLPDTTIVPLDVSLSLLESVHVRWVTLLRAMSEGDWQRRYNHPETGTHDLNHMLALYAWHGPHHTAHITQLRRARGW